MTYEPGEGPIDDPKAAHDRAQVEHAKHLKGDDPRDADTDLEDPTKQENDE